MNRRLLEYLVCPASGEPLELEMSHENDGEVIEGTLRTASGNSYPIRRGIPRFVLSEGYADTFGFEWNRHSRIYLGGRDAKRVYSKPEQMERKLGLGPSKLDGRVVLDAGCGTGANARVTSAWGAREVICVDLSSAVEAAYENTRDLDNVHVIQADLFKLPFRASTFDVIYSIGVLHHTSDTRDAFMSILEHLKPGGLIALWVYYDFHGIPRIWSDALRKVTSRMNSRVLHSLCWIAVPAYYVYRVPVLGKFIFSFMPPISKEPYWEDRVLDTFDWYSPAYQWKHTFPEAYRWFTEAGLSDIHLLDVPVALWGRKPEADQPNQA